MSPSTLGEERALCGLNGRFAALPIWLSLGDFAYWMISSENRLPLFGIMLQDEAMGGFAREAVRRVAGFVRDLALALAWLFRAARRLLYGAIVFTAGVAILAIAINLLFRVPHNVAFRALDPSSDACRSPSAGWDILADPSIGNDENGAIDRGLASEGAVDWEMRLRCSIQTHAIPGYQPLDLAGAPVGDVRSLTYDLAFVEFQENGDPYLLCNESEYKAGDCDGTTFRPSRSGPEAHRGQLEALLKSLRASPKNYVVAFIHGWRNNADIANGNVADLRVYAGHAARFVADRCAWGDQRFCGMKTTALFIGWRGARSDENHLRRFFARIAKPICGVGTCWLTNVGNYIGTIAATFTLFDRKPVSEAIAPSVISALRAVARQIGVQGALRPEDLAPCESAVLLRGATPVCQSGASDASKPQARMIIFGHSLGGNVLATGLMDETMKLVDRHKPADFLPPPLGNLVVLLNPASEAAKWTGIQRAVWRRIAMSDGDEARLQDFIEGHKFFRDEQRPVVIAATAARDWPPDGVWPTDCADLARLANPPPQDKGKLDIINAYRQQAKRGAQSIDYDWSTYDLFPAFRFDFRPLASSLERFAQRDSNPVNADPSADAEPSDITDLLNGCAIHRPSSILGWLAHWAGALLRVFPFMNTDAEQTHTIGQFDPPRSPESITSGSGFSERPFGTTHQLVGWDENAPAARRLQPLGHGLGDKELTVGYGDVVGREAQCPLATGWLTKARAKALAQNNGASAVRWNAGDLPPDSRPALRFQHGFYPAHLPPITRANDPFWNLRALDNALAEHDGYMLSSFICAMQQLVLDDITDIAPTPPPPP